MAKVTAPFLSLSARGSVAGTLTASQWKGIKTMRQKSNPANPNTAAQQTQRGLLADTVQAWRLGSMTAALKTAWNLAAGLSGKPQSGFNLYTSAAIAGLKESATAVTGTGITATSASATIACVLTAKTIASDTTTDLSGLTLKMKGGLQPDQLVKECSCTGGAAGGTITPAGIASGMSANGTYYIQYFNVVDSVYIPITGIIAVAVTIS